MVIKYEVNQENEYDKYDKKVYIIEKRSLEYNNMMTILIILIAILIATLIILTLSKK